VFLRELRAKQRDTSPETTLKIPKNAQEPKTIIQEYNGYLNTRKSFNK
jgi:hypothetical protein